MRRRLYVVIGLITVLSGCAANRISGPSGDIGKDVAVFQGDLSKFQDELKFGQDSDRAIIAGMNARRDVAAAVARQMQVEWAISVAQGGTEIFESLQAHGREEVTRLLTPAPSSRPPAPISLPTDKLAAAAKVLDRLSKGQSSRADIESLVKYLIETNEKLKDPSPAMPQTAPAATQK